MEVLGSAGPPSQVVRGRYLTAGVYPICKWVGGLWSTWDSWDATRNGSPRQACAAGRRCFENAFTYVLRLLDCDTLRHTNIYTEDS